MTGQAPAELRLTWRTDTKARKHFEERLFGKRILFTNRDWPVAEVVAAYRSQSDAEFGFRQLKDPQVVSFSPMHHWTDSKIRVHVFYCVLALAVAHLMRRHAAQAGLHLSVRELLDSPASKKPCCSTTTAARDAPAYSACSPTPTPPSSASLSCSTFTDTHPHADPTAAEPGSWVIRQPCSKTRPCQAKPERQSPKAGNSR